ncbi:sigma-54 interaction domain-containing protein [Sporomusa aerivorans]|uniref:sigma-54 interaction domain-containing protein n=1 Tax=Sporomusa aerivorans TaxID=204936 RepID=UPI00352B5935
MAISDKHEKLGALFDVLQETQSWFLHILDSIYDGLLICDADFVVRYINPEYTRITGVAYETIVGRELSEVRPGAILPQVIFSGVPLAGVYRREGETEYVVDMAPIMIDGQVAGGISIVKDVTEVHRLSQQVNKFEKKANRLKKMVEHAYRARYSFKDLIGQSGSIQKAVQFAKKVAVGVSDILITGESGTGKEIFAQAIHSESKRSHGPFVALNCASLTSSLVESELFGYEEGAFTGARKGGKTGLFEIADGGTILLDEIGELSLEIQSKLLRVLQERAIRKVGEAGEVELDIRVIAATNRNLADMVKEGRFRHDLLYRLNVLNLHLPPLRERGGDVAALADHFLTQFSQKVSRPFRFSPEVYGILQAYNWPGNIRELRNVIEFAANMCEENLITQLHLPPVLLVESTSQTAPSKTLADMVCETERQLIINALRGEDSSVEGKRKAAKRLGVSLATLYNKMNRFGIAGGSD